MLFRSKTLKGNDHYHAMDAKDARKILKGIDFLDCIRGSYELSCLESEKPARTNARRSLVSSVDIAKGAIIEEKMLTFKRPGTGIQPEDLKKLLGKRAAIDISRDTVLKWEMFEAERDKDEYTNGMD